MQHLSETNRVVPAGLLAGIAFGTVFFLVLFLATGSLAATPSWQPSASERLVKLPSSYLKKAIDRDFADSELSSALEDLKSRASLKTQTLQDLQAAIDKADGEVRTELRHQFLAEKQEFIRLMGEQQELRKKTVATKIRLYERLLSKLERRQAGTTPARADLIAKQDAARARFEQTVSAVDMKMFGSAALAESKYTRDYAKNMAAIESLVQAIKEHPMNHDPEIDGKTVTKEDYLRQLIAENQADLSIVEQEESILGYMAKLVALDAMALSEDLADDADLAEGILDDDGEVSISSSVDFFITQ